MNPFSAFAFNGEKSNVAFRDPSISSSLHPNVGIKTMVSKSKEIGNNHIAKKRKIAPSDPMLMVNWWEELKLLSTNYPFAVMVTGILGSQCRDIVTIGKSHMHYFYSKYV